MLFSILICSITSRKLLFERLYQFLTAQITEEDVSDKIEILVFEDDCVYPVGVKRNMLIESASGDFVAFIDDDDWVSDTYISNIYTVLKSNPKIDCVGFKGKIINESFGYKPFTHSINNKNYTEDNSCYYRPPNHLNPIRRELIKNVKFPHKNFGEDFDWSMEVANGGILKNEVFIDKYLYYYYYNFRLSATQNIYGRKYEMPY